MDGDKMNGAETDEEVKERNKDGKLSLIIKWSATTKRGEK